MPSSIKPILVTYSQSMIPGFRLHLYKIADILCQWNILSEMT